MGENLLMKRKTHREKERKRGWEREETTTLGKLTVLSPSHNPSHRKMLAPFLPAVEGNLFRFEFLDSISGFRKLFYNLIHSSFFFLSPSSNSPHSFVFLSRSLIPNVGVSACSFFLAWRLWKKRR